MKTRSWQVATPSRRPAGQSGTRRNSKRDWQNQRRELELAEVVKRLGEKMLDGDSLLQTNRQDAAHCDHILRSRINLLSSLHLSHVWEKGSLEVQYAWQDDPAKLFDNFGQAVKITESEKKKLAK